MGDEAFEVARFAMPSPKDANTVIMLPHPEDEGKQIMARFCEGCVYYAVFPPVRKGRRLEWPFAVVSNKVAGVGVADDGQYAYHLAIPLAYLESEDAKLGYAEWAAGDSLFAEPTKFCPLGDIAEG
jgi:hypothetical protein